MTSTRAETVSTPEGDGVSLAYNYNQTAGCPGQYTIGTFTAGSTSQSFTLYGSPVTQLNALQVRMMAPNAAFSRLPTGLSIIHGQSVITLSGKVSTPGPVYPAQGETITATINGNAQTATIIDASGNFSFNYNCATIPASATPYTINYAYVGDASLSAPPNDTSTTLTVNPIAVVLTGKRGYNGTATAASGILSVSNQVGSENVTVASSLPGDRSRRVLTSGTRDIQDAKAKPLAAKTVAVPFLARVTGLGAVLPGVDMQILTFDRLVSGETGGAGAYSNRVPCRGCCGACPHRRGTPCALNAM